MAELGPIDAVRIFVFDLAPARAFYAEALGMTCTAEDADYAVFGAGGCSLIVEAVGPDDVADHALVGRFTGVSFAVEDIAAAYVRLQARGARFFEAPKRQPWGGMLAHFEDPAGNVLTVVERPR